MIDTLQSNILLGCTHMMVVPVESVLLVPNKGDEVTCSQCHAQSKIIRVGTPYRIKHYEQGENPSQTKLETE